MNKALRICLIAIGLLVSSLSFAADTVKLGLIEPLSGAFANQGEDAVHNIGRAALLVAALARGEWSALDVATQDKIHQPARTAIFPAMPDIFAAAKDAGALCAYLSGGGSTIAAFCIDNEERIARAMMQQAIARGHPGRTQITTPSDTGATVVSES